MQLVPGGLGSAADVGIVHRAEQLRKTRLKTFFNELANSRVPLTQQIIESDDFLHCFFCATRAAMNTRREEKIILFAKILQASVSFTPPDDLDEIEELIGVVDKVSGREWKALTILSSFDKTFRIKGNNDLQWAMTFWNEFEAAVSKELAIPPYEVAAFLNHIERTGLYAQFVGGFMDYAGGVGKLTQKFYRLIDLIQPV